MKIFPKEVRVSLVTGSLRVLPIFQLNFLSLIYGWIVSSNVLELTHMGLRELIFSVSSQLTVISCSKFEIGGGGSIYTREIGKYHKSWLFPPELIVKHLSA